jgi:hypothetical protein
MELKHCPKCDHKVLPTSGDACPACGSALSGVESMQVTSAEQPKPTSSYRPFVPGSPEALRVVQEDRLALRARWSWAFPLIIIAIDFLARLLVYRSFTVTVFEACLLLWIVSGVATLVLASVCLRQATRHGLPSVRPQVVTGVVISVLLVGWMSFSYYNLKAAQRAARRIYQEQQQRNQEANNQIQSTR